MAVDQFHGRDLSKEPASPDDESHIRGVVTAMKPAEAETVEESQGGEVVSLFRAQAFQNVGEALFSESELQRYARPGERERSACSLMMQLELVFPYRFNTMSETYEAYKDHVAALLQKITVANDVGELQYSAEVDRDAEKFLQRNPHGSAGYEVQLKDLHKLFYLFQASQNVAARMGF